MCNELPKRPTFKSDSVVGLACFDYSDLLTLHRSQAAEFYCRLFRSFCVLGLLSNELRNIHIDDYMQFVDDLQVVFLADLHIGPNIEYMVTVKSSVGQVRRHFVSIQTVLLVFGTFDSNLFCRFFRFNR